MDQNELVPWSLDGKPGHRLRKPRLEVSNRPPHIGQDPSKIQTIHDDQTWFVD